MKRHTEGGAHRETEILIYPLTVSDKLFLMKIFNCINCITCQVPFNLIIMTDERGKEFSLKGKSSYPPAAAFRNV